jgi:hypothetical protein
MHGRKCLKSCAVQTQRHVMHEVRPQFWQMADDHRVSQLQDHSDFFRAMSVPFNRLLP